MSELNQNVVRKEIGGIIDPDLGKSLDELGSIEKVEIDGNKVSLYLKLVQPIHNIAEKINIQCIEKINKIAPGAEPNVFVGELTPEDSGRKVLHGVKNIIAVASGKGGVGKSAIAANIAAALSLTGAKVGILDADVYGPSQPTMFGLEGTQLHATKDEEGNTVAFPAEQYGIKVASMGFVMNKDEAAIVRGPMLAGYFSMLFEQIQWGELDYLVFDLPPGTGDIQLTLVQKIPLTGAVVVTTPQDIALADVRRAIAMFNRVNVDILGIIENMSYFVPPDMPDKKYYIFGKGGGEKMAKDYNVNMLGEVPLDMGMREANDSGRPVAFIQNNRQAEILRELSDSIIKEIRLKNAQKISGGDLEISL
ncbi:MAG: P-loop NTPase [Candidatus Kapaibacterium sp.]